MFRVVHFVVFILYSGLLQARTIEVCPECPLATIAAGIGAASDGDVVLVKSGTYTEYGLTVDRSIHLKGHGWPVVDAREQGAIFTIVKNGVTLEGFQIQNVGTSYLEDRAAIRVRRARDFTIRNNRLINTFFGIYLEHCKKGLIESNDIRGEALEEMSSGNAIHLWYSDEVIVRNNFVSHHRDGIYLEFVNRSSVTGNTSEDNLRYGLHFMFSNDDEYSHNSFSRNGAGVAVMFSRRISMRENTFAQNWGKSAYGLLLKEIFDAEIHDNRFLGNTIGIYVEGSNRIRYFRNEFRRNGWAIKVSGGCLDNTVEGNNFIDNSFDLSMTSAMGNNRFLGNYWSDYRGYDLDRDGTGDVPYRPVKLFNYVVNKTPEAMILLRSLFIDLLNFAEKVSPIFTPAEITDPSPRMQALVLN